MSHVGVRLLSLADPIVPGAYKAGGTEDHQKLFASGTNNRTNVNLDQFPYQVILSQDSKKMD